MNMSEKFPSWTGLCRSYLDLLLTSVFIGYPKHLTRVITCTAPAMTWFLCDSGVFKFRWRPIGWDTLNHTLLPMSRTFIKIYRTCFKIITHSLGKLMSTLRWWYILIKRWYLRSTWICWLRFLVILRELSYVDLRYLL